MRKRELSCPFKIEAVRTGATAALSGEPHSVRSSTVAFATSPAATARFVFTQEAVKSSATQLGSLPTLRVMVLADVRLYREGLARVLAGHPSLVVVAAAPVNEASLLRVQAEHVDVILLDAATVCETHVVQDLARLAPEARVVAYGMLDAERQALPCAEAGVATFVPGEATGEQLGDAILDVGRGEINCSPRVTALLVNRLQSLSRGLAPVGVHARLTSRERAILALIEEGHSNKEIATRLGIELCTVKNNVHHVLEKLQVARRSQAVARIRRERLLRFPA